MREEETRKKVEGAGVPQPCLHPLVPTIKVYICTLTYCQDSTSHFEILPIESSFPHVSVSILPLLNSSSTTSLLSTQALEMGVDMLIVIIELAVGKDEAIHTSLTPTTSKGRERETEPS